MMTLKKGISTVFYLCFALISSAQHNQTFEIQNYHGVTKVAYFLDAVTPISMAVMGAWNIKENKTIKFSKRTKLNLDSLDKRINDVKKYLPSDYIRNLLGSFWKFNEPDQDSAIWVTKIFLKAGEKGQYIPCLAFKITFEGTDAMKERLDPKILNVEFITEKDKLKQLAEQLKSLPDFKN